MKLHKGTLVCNKNGVVNLPKKRVSARASVRLFKKLHRWIQIIQRTYERAHVRDNRTGRTCEIYFSSLATPIAVEYCAGERDKYKREEYAERQYTRDRMFSRLNVI